MTLRTFIFLCAALGLLAGCGGGSSTAKETSKKPATFLIEVPGGGQGGRPSFLTANIRAFNDYGTVSSAFVTISYLVSDKPFGNPPRLPVDGATTVALLNATQTGTGAGMVTNFAKSLARQTYCRSGPISKAQGVRRISEPGEISKVVAASRQNNGRDTVPAGVKGVAVDATRYDASFGTPKWTVHLNCNAPQG